jgi:methylated-DNA-[protein]-cysteine S-methyltransferase
MGARRFVYEIDGWGSGELWLNGRVLLWHELPDSLGAPQPTTRFQPTEDVRKRVKRDRARTATVEEATAASLITRIRAYFAGNAVSFADVELDLEGYTPFQLAVNRTLRAVPHGDVVAYGELAALAGYPNAGRAVGTFCARNRVALVVPCHRVVAASGLGSYGSLGPGVKRRLLALEGVDL